MGGAVRGSARRGSPTRRLPGRGNRSGIAGGAWAVLPPPQVPCLEGMPSRLKEVPPHQRRSACWRPPGGSLSPVGVCVCYIFVPPGVPVVGGQVTRALRPAALVHPPPASVPLPPPAGQHREASFRAVNPLMKLPALKDGDFALAERYWWGCCWGWAPLGAPSPHPLPAHLFSPHSIAILLYLARKFRTPDHWYPSDLQQRARVDEFLSWQHTGIRMFGSKVFLIKVGKGSTPLGGGDGHLPCCA